MAKDTNTSGGEKQPNKFAMFFIRIGRWFKAAGLELGKTTWPKFPVVMKKLGIVLAVVAMFFVVLMIMDIVLGIGYNALIDPRGNWWEFWNALSRDNIMFLPSGIGGIG